MLRIPSVKVNSLLASVAFGSVLLTGAAFAQQGPNQPPQKPAAASPKPVGKDPFDTPPFLKKKEPKIVTPVKTTPKVAKAGPPAPSLVKPPDIQARVNYYKEQKRACIIEQCTPPKPTTAFLIEEIEVAGIFRTPRGYAAMVNAKPIGLSYVIYPGENLYDGQLVAIDEDHAVFRHHLNWSDGRIEEKIERKALRQATVNDPLLEEKKSPGAATPPPAAAPAAPAAAPTEGVPATAPATAPAIPTAKPAASFGNALINSLPTRGSAETETTKPAPEFSNSPAPAAASGNAPAKPAATSGKGKPKPSAKPKKKQ
jgi:hypothetical protein